MFKVWQNSTPFGSRPIGGAIEALLTEFVNWRSSVLPIVVLFVAAAVSVITLPNGAENAQRVQYSQCVLVDKLVATTRGWQMGTENNQLRQWPACRGVGGAAAAQCPIAALLGQEGGGGCAAVLVGLRQGIGGGEG
jgi:hypothetical protein